MRKRIYRSTTEKVIGGVCAGLGEYFNIDPTWVRILFVVAIFAKGLGLLAYVICWIVFPRDTEVGAEASAAGASIEGETTAAESSGKKKSTARGGGFLPGIILVILGMIFLLDQAFYWFDFDYIWPLLLIGIGVMLLYRSTSPKREEQSVATNSENKLEVDNGRC